ncbi:MAG: LysM peptidoglycan-binding domain-containing protein [Bryobacteraceae bacterium]
MDKLEELKNKYASVLETVKQKGVRLSHLHVQNNKLFMQGAAPSEAAKNDVWNQIKAVDSSYSDLNCDLTVDTNLPAPETQVSAGAPSSTNRYTVKAGDTLSKIAKEIYGNANEYHKIFEANQDKLQSPDKIQVGQELVIPN